MSSSDAPASFGAIHKEPKVAFGTEAIFPTPASKRASPCFTTNANPLLKAATAVVFSSSSGASPETALCDQNTTAEKAIEQTMHLHATNADLRGIFISPPRLNRQ